MLFAGHVGYIYQGGGYRIAGRSARRTQWQLLDGLYLNGVTMSISCGASAGTTRFTR
ncbi:hypothetical protein [Dactylosporangium sp. NPDC005555]|uniref:hypothetical protein n=1 Tax=Dactylosporangium sp. NPDC005555 TaxID=3154889 RepID=UPI0033B19168